MHMHMYVTLDNRMQAKREAHGLDGNMMSVMIHTWQYMIKNVRNATRNLSLVVIPWYYDLFDERRHLFGSKYIVFMTKGTPKYTVIAGTITYA